MNPTASIQCYFLHDLYSMDSKVKFDNISSVIAVRKFPLIFDTLSESQVTDTHTKEKKMLNADAEFSEFYAVPTLDMFDLRELKLLKRIVCGVFYRRSRH